MSAHRPAGEAVLAGIVALAAGEARPGAVVDGALGLIAEATSAAAVALWTGDAAGPGMELRGVAGGDAGPGTAGRLGRTGAPGIAARLAAGDDAGPGTGLDEELARAGLPGGRVLVARHAGRTLGALGLAPAAAADEAGEDALRAAAQLLALALRDADLAAGVRDRVRELDRQSLQLTALTAVARRVAGSQDPAEAHRILVAEARALVRAHQAALLMPGPGGGAPRAVAGDGGLVDDAAAAREVDRAMGGVPVRGSGRMVVPIPSSGGPGGPAMGVIVVARARGGPFAHDDQERLQGLAAQASIALANARLVADLRREQRGRRSLAAAIVLAQEQERRRIAEDLHDGPVQELVGVGLLLDALATDLATRAPESVQDVARAAAAARESVRALRRAITDLHPLLLEQVGFAAAVGSAVERLEWAGARVSVDVAAAEALTPAAQTVAFRVVQEAVANVVRHAGASRVDVDARRSGADIVLRVRDDGRGFDPAAARPGLAEGHLGLAAIEERARLSGGGVTIRSAPGGGTEVELVLPADGAGPDQTGGEESRARAADRASSSAKRSSTTT